MIILTAMLLAIVLGQATPPRDARVATATPVTASLSGRVTDDLGAPIAGVTVIAAGGPPPGARTATTSESGRYTIAGLAAGRYAVSAVRSGYPPVNYGQARANGPGKTFEIGLGQQTVLAITMPRGAVISGTLVDDRGEPVAGGVSITPEWTAASGRKRGLVLSAATNTRGGFRAYGLAAGAYRVGKGLGEDGAPTGMLVTVAPGEERSGIVVRVEPPRPRTYITVAVTTSAGEQPKQFQLILRRAGELRPVYSSNRPNPDGTRTLTDITAGRYLIVARAGTAWGGTEVAVDGEHPATASITLLPGARVRGIVTLEPGARRPEDLSMQLIPADTSSLLDGGNTVIGTVGVDGSFTLTGVPPGRYLLRTTLGADEPLRLLSAAWRGVDIADVPLSVAYEDVGAVAVTLTSRSATLKGTVTDTAGNPLNGIDVVAFPLEENLRVRNSRRVATSRTGMSGEYEMRGLPPGDYALALVDEVDPEALRDPSIFAQLTPVSTVTVNAGETRHDVVVR